MENCLKGAIGISKKECDCIEPLNEELKKSSSGYFLHELSGIEPIQTVQEIVNCENLNEFYTTLLRNSEREASDDLTAQITERYTKKESDFSGFLGSRSFSKSIPTDKPFFGVKIVPRKRSDGVIYINSVGICFDKNTEFDAKILRYYKETQMLQEVDTIEGLISTANAYVENSFDSPIKLPLSLDGEGEIEYYIVVDNVEDVNAKNNSNSCGCGRKERKLLSMISFSGVKGDNVENISDWSSDNSHVNGIVLNAEIRCDSEMFICTMNKVNEGWRKYMAQAILYKTAWKLHEEVLSSTVISQAVMMNRESMEKRKGEFDHEYWIRIKYLVQNMDMDQTTCYECNNNNLKVSQILL